MGGNFGLPTESLYQDTKKLLGQVIAPVMRPIRKRLERRELLRSFSPAMVGHPRRITDFPTYYVWHEDDSDWQEGNGLMVSATYHELLEFWILPDHFVPYEAMLKGFLNRGGEIRRVFLIGPNLADPVRLWALERTLLRHEILGFSPRVLSLLDLRVALRCLGIKCDHFAVLNGRIAYFFKHSGRELPVMLRTVEPTVVLQAENEFQPLWKKAEMFNTWYKLQAYPLPQEVIEQVDLDIKAVNNAVSSAVP